MTQGRKHGRWGRSHGGRAGPRAKPLRRVMVVGLSLAGLVAGFLSAEWSADESPGPDVRPSVGGGGQASGATPWYLTQGKPPAMVRQPNTPLLPHESEGPARPYEEALPRGVFVSPARPALQPAIKTPDRRPETAHDPAGEPPWQRFAVRATWPAKRAAVVIIIDDMGVDRKRSAAISALPGPLTLSYLTYAEDLAGQTKAARAHGHELMLHLPMEPMNGKLDPGPNALMTGLTVAELERRIDWSLDRFSGYVGVNNHMGSRFTAQPDVMHVLGRKLAKRGLLFVDSRTAADSVGAKIVRALGVPALERNVFLDNDDTEDGVHARLADVERMARAHTFAIAIGHPRDATLRALARWLPTVEAKGLVLVPVSALLLDTSGRLNGLSTAEH